MKESEQKAAAKAFAAHWQGKGYEKGETQPFWLSLLRDVYGVEQPESFIFFEGKVNLGHASFIDATIPETHVMIEQKGLGKDLSKPIKQSDGTMLTPYQQAKRYAAELPYSKRPRWIVACNFAEFRVYDMENPQSEPEIILLENLPKEYYRLQFLVNAANRNIKKEDEELAAFPYVNGGLFEDSRADLQRQIPGLNEEILGLLLKNASADFDWSGISPTIFGAVFESTLNPETRRKGGMHYTSIPNIHKLIVYNNFPWPTPTEEQKSSIERTAQAILSARETEPDASLADLYDEALMPAVLRKAHQANDRAVMKAYGFNVGGMTEAACVAKLMKMYQALTEKA